MGALRRRGRMGDGRMLNVAGLKGVCHCVDEVTAMSDAALTLEITASGSDSHTLYSAGRTSSLTPLGRLGRSSR